MKPESSRKIESNHTLTLSHGKQLFDQGKTIATKIELLQPLLALLDETEIDPETDPIAKIVEILESISIGQQTLNAALADCSQKLDFLIDCFTERPR